jgi:exodeoxyribonuclease-3
MKLATWNVNSVKARLEAARDWLKEAEPDVVCLQEIKTMDEAFPRAFFEDIGYNCAVHGQKTYNGVAILSKRPLEDVTLRLPGGDSDDHARYIEAVVAGDSGSVRVASIYAPNGNPIGTDKFRYKLSWLERLAVHARSLLLLEEPVALMGDINVIPSPDDCYDPKAWEMDALFQPESRAALRRIEYLGYSDAFRACHSETQQ